MALSACATSDAGTGPGISAPTPAVRDPEASADRESPQAATTPDGAESVTVGWTIPWAIGGERIRRDGTRGNDPGEWPPFAVDAVRLWDTRTAWLNLEPRDDAWHWIELDAHVAMAEERGVEHVSLVLAGTPRWAALRETADDAPWLGPGSAAPPSDPREWSEYVATVARRYSGRIDAYEIGNEPNLTTFWNGTPEQYADLVRRAAQEIHRADSRATVVVNAGLIRRPSDVAELQRWLAPIARDQRLAEQVDVISLHFYPGRLAIDDARALLGQATDTLDRLGLGAHPRWITEANVRNGAGMTGPQQRRAIDTLTEDARQRGFSRLYWYAWTDLGPPDLIPFVPGSPAATEFTTPVATG